MPAFAPSASFDPGQRQKTMEGNPMRDGSREDPQQQLSTTDDDDIPACQSCRKRKLRCSRQMPACSQCTRLRCACLYLTRQKPGMKSGAVDNLNRRLENLEKLLLDANGDRKSALRFLDVDAIDGSPQCPQRSNTNEMQQSSNGQAEFQSGMPSQMSSSSKRRRMTESPEGPNRIQELELESSILPALPHPSLLQAIVNEHFSKVHHWIPILHQSSFMAKLNNRDQNSKLGVLLHALVSASFKYVNIEAYGLSVDEMHRRVRASRDMVMLNAMEIPSVENLQALVILAFDLMGCGQVPKAWSIIGSLTRTVEYLQLTVEPDEAERNLLLQPLILLEKSANWTEDEERRRLFWNVFLLDRICSVTSGWNTSLTSNDMRRRLPSNGANWAREEAVVTPYFGIWDKSAARIGNSIAYIPALYPSPQLLDHATIGSPTAKGGISNVDVSKLGAFAYCIESTESLSQVTSYFLRQVVDFQDRQEVVSWLTRFKELDMRLVHWKMFLPQRWKDSDVSRDNYDINMDPNLTLAHITHNTSMILLHQHIAYTPGNWAGLVTLPSSCSVETCQSAASETSSITQKYLSHMKGIVNSQFCFCIFVAARILLVHWRIHDDQSLSPEFFSLVESLEEISRRWWGYPTHDSAQSLCLATTYALHLKELHAKCVNEEGVGSDLLRYPNVGGLLPPLSIPDSRTSPAGQARERNVAGTPKPTDHSNAPSPNHLRSAKERAASLTSQRFQLQNANNYESSEPTTPLPNFSSTNDRFDQFSGLVPTNISGTNVMGQNSAVDSVEDELTAMSNLLLGQQFLEMDRVIPFDGTNFDYQDMYNW